MGIINWARGRFSAKTDSRAQERCQVAPGKDVTSEQQQQWPHHQDLQAGLFSIGTLGNEEPRPPEDHRATSTAHDLPEFTIEEAEKLQDALEKLLRLRRARSKRGAARGSGAGADSLGLPLDRFLNCPSSLEVDRRVQRKCEEGGDVDYDGGGEINGDLSPNTKIILTMAKDLLTNSGSSSGAGIKNKSFKFLLKKMFACHGGFAPAPSFKDPVESRIDKFFRTVLGKKISVRPSNATAAKNYFLEDRPEGKSRVGHRRREEDNEEEDCCRWDRTDSEFIVLEI